ncbi:adenosylcobinamide-GDP ribazoletransferase [Aeromicrobium sp. CTD01-1L150]|uniref:adenosylcobinamide-GDP ribazoletransferase n=1 Tax=Aeromicrobium sp. CTD01-1L150 TaxID=3341830 RepID=UPI0035BF95E6
MIDSWRFAVGTLTAIPVKPPRRGGRAVSGPAMVLAPLAVVPLGLLVALVCLAGRELGLAPLGVAAAAVGALALGSRAFHLDGLADTADGLTASYDTERSLAVMRTGDVGPAGAASLVLVLGVQIGALSSLLSLEHGPWLAGILVVVSRGAVAITCMRGVPGARRDGLGATYVGAVHPAVAALVWLLLTAITTGGFLLVDETWWRGPLSIAAALLVVAVIVRRAITRLGGVTGDVFGASIELSLAALLLSAT